jgi:hypothetical protein
MNLEALTVLHSVINQVPPSSGNISTPKMEVAYSSEMLVGIYFYLGAARFKAQLGYRLSLLNYFVIFLSLFRRMPEQNLNYVTRRFLPHPCYSIVLYNLYMTPYSLLQLLTE